MSVHACVCGCLRTRGRIKTTSTFEKLQKLQNEQQIRYSTNLEHITYILFWLERHQHPVKWVIQMLTLADSGPPSQVETSLFT